MSTYEIYESQEGPFETGYETSEGPFETGYETGYEVYEGEDEQFLGDILRKIGGVVGPQLPGIAKGIYGALTSEGESPLSETQEMELTAELLEIASEEELEEFLGNLFKGVAKGVGGFIKSPVGKALGGVLKGVAKKALPVVGGALGSFVAPGVGTAIGSKLGSLASGLFEMELEGMTQEQAEFEVARRVVRLAATSAAAAAQAPPSAPPAQVARVAFTEAARQHAPGLLRGTSAEVGPGAARRQPRPGQSGRPRRPGGRPPGAAAYPQGGTSISVSGNGGGGPSYGNGGDPQPYGDDYSQSYGGRPQTGRWMRRGRKIVLLGV
jgi:uncharacterized protein (DUF697 family)